MTIEGVGLVAISLCILLSPLLYACYLEWLENRRGGASDWHKARIRDPCAQLGQKPPPEEELEALSFKKATQMANRLDHSMSIRRELDMARGVPMIDPKVHLKGATPEKLARALLRNRNPALRPGRVGKPVVGDQVAEQEVPSDESGDGIPHLAKGV